MQPPATGVYALILLLGTPIAWSMALAHLLRYPAPRSGVLAAIYLCTGYWHLAGALSGTGWIALYPGFYRTEIPFTLATGPLCYTYFRMLLEEDFSWRTRRHGWIFLPAILAPLLYIPLYMIENRPDFISRTIHHGDYNVFQITIILGVCWNLSFLVYGSLKFLHAGRAGLRRSHRLALMMFLGFVFIATGIDLFAWNAVLVSGEVIFTFSTTIALLLILIMHIARPNFMNELAENVKQRRYRKSRLDGVPVAALRDKLIRAMESERLFLRDDLSLSSLAMHMEINPASLSELINGEFGRNFNSFVNEHRIREACRIFEDAPESTVLHVCYACGFNTPSAFHAAFKAMTGTSPASYRGRLKSARGAGGKNHS